MFSSNIPDGGACQELTIQKLLFFRITLETLCHESRIMADLEHT